MYIAVDKKLSKTKYVLDIKSDGYEFIPKINDFVINKMIIYDKNLIEFTINQKYISRYKKILKIVMEILNSDDNTETDYQLILGEIEKAEGIILNQYKKHIEMEETKKMLKDLYMLKQELRKKFEYSMVFTEEKSKSR